MMRILVVAVGLIWAVGLIAGVNAGMTNFTYASTGIFVECCGICGAATPTLGGGWD